MSAAEPGPAHPGRTARRALLALTTIGAAFVWFVSGRDGGVSSAQPAAAELTALRRERLAVAVEMYDRLMADYEAKPRRELVPDAVNAAERTLRAELALDPTGPAAVAAYERYAARVERLWGQEQAWFRSGRISIADPDIQSRFARSDARVRLHDARNGRLTSIAPP